MFHPSTLITEAQRHGADVFTGVPCSFLQPLINFAIDNPGVSYVPLNNEGEALAFACGAYLAGRRPIVMFQNSGLGNMINPLTSLAHPFRIPLLLICSWRGRPGMADEPQHELMGMISSQLLSLVGVENETLPDSEVDLVAAFKRAYDHLEQSSLSFAFIMPKDLLKPYRLQSRLEKKATVRSRIRKGKQSLPRFGRFDLLQAACSIVGTEHVIISTAGKTGRELYVCRDSPNHLYMVGGMGCAASVALGMALHLPVERRVVVIDGDGAALMRLEAMVSIGYYRPKSLVHVLIDNNAHESTGGQQTLSDGVAFDTLAVGCGYANAISICTLGDFEVELRRAMSADGPSLIHALILPGSLRNLPRPAVAPHEVKERIMSFLGISRAICGVE